MNDYIIPSRNNCGKINLDVSRLHCNACLYSNMMACNSGTANWLLALWMFKKMNREQTEGGLQGILNISVWDW